jgi:disulfide oxidoreductase YuzD
MKTFWARVVLLLGAVALLASCSHMYFPTSKRIGEAREALAKAKAAGAETKAPMDYYMAQEYLVYADKEAVGDGDNKQAQVFAEKSKKHSEAAIQKAGGGAK